MKKNLLALLASGVMGCSYSVNTELLHKPALFWHGTKPALVEKYSPYGEHCTRRVYVGKHSVAETFHCSGKDYLTFISEEQRDTDDNGKVDKACFVDLRETEYGTSSPIVKKEVGCIGLRNKRSLSDVANEYLTR